jgi:LysR family transcriptional regulator, transcriptional activator of the cysJI operon
MGCVGTITACELTVYTFNLQAFVAVFDNGSVSTAARELSMTQAGVSMLLHRLENHYRVKLFQRTATGVAPTAAGEALYAYATEVLRLEGTLSQRLESERERSQGWVGIGSTPGIAGYVLPEILSEFRKIHPDWQVTVEIPGWPAVRDRVCSGSLDFAVMAGQTDPELASTPVRRERLLIVAAPDDPLAGLASADPSSVLHSSFVLAARHSETQRMLEEEISKAIGSTERVRLDIALATTDAEAKKEAVRRGLGYGIMSESLVERELRDGSLCEIHLAGVSLSRDINLVHRRQGRPSPAASALFTAILESGATLAATPSS